MKSRREKKVFLLVALLFLVTTDRSFGDCPEGYASSVTQYGVTWNFDACYRAGHFFNGDFWILPDDPEGEVLILSVDPAPEGEGVNYRNGSMVNPMPGGRQGYDGRANGYSEDYSVSFPLILPSNSSLISSISRGEDECFNPPGSGLYSNECSRGVLATAAVLTILDSQPPDDAFRPAYCGGEKVIHRTGDVKIHLLPDLTSVDNHPSLNEYARGFQRVWLDHVLDWTGQFIRPNDHMPSYGRDMTRHIGDAFLLLSLGNIGERESLAFNMVQLGIDLYGIIENGGYFPPNGGHNAGRKLPILFAGWMLYDGSAEGAAKIRAAEMYNIGIDPAGTARFQEDEQTFYITDDFLERGLRVTACRGLTTSATSNTIGVFHPESYAQLDDLWIEITSGPGGGQRRYITESGVPRLGGEGILTVTPDWDIPPVTGLSEYRVKGYESFHIGMPEWGIRGDGPMSNPSWSAEYRTLNGYSYPGIVLAARLFGLKDIWNHDPLFDYQDRYMYESSNEGMYPGWRNISGFAGRMWDSYRTEIPGADTTRPFATVMYPVDGNILSDMVSLKARAFGIHGINSIQFYLNGEEIGDLITGISEEPPRAYILVWNTRNHRDGIHALTAVATDSRGNRHESRTVEIYIDNEGGSLGMADEEQTPVSFELYQNYPNPFNPVTSITYSTTSTDRTSLIVYDILGREVITLVNEIKPAGTHTVQWDGRGTEGHYAGSGVYIYELRSGNGRVSTKKMIMIK